MIYCIPAEGTEGLSAPVSGHFGRCSYFTIHNDQTGETATVANGNTHDEHGQCRPLESIEGLGVNVVLAGGMGRGAVSRLNAAGIDVFCPAGTPANLLTVGQLLEAYRTGSLEPLTPQSACGGHGEHGGHQH